MVRILVPAGHLIRIALHCFLVSRAFDRAEADLAEPCIGNQRKIYPCAVLDSPLYLQSGVGSPP
ncbi:hypothetical protein D3C73_1402050 [compost metagenome]